MARLEMPKLERYGLESATWWDIEGRYKVNTVSGAKVVINDVNIDLLNRLYNVYKPKRLLIDSWEKMLPTILRYVKHIDNGNPHVEFKNIVSMFYKVYSAFNLIDHKDYDMIIRARLDVDYQGQLCLPQIRSDTIFIPQQNDHNGYNDQFAIGDYQSMLKYSSIIHYLDQYQLQEISGERLMRAHLSKMQLNIERIQLNSNIPMFEYGHE